MINLYQNCYPEYDEASRYSVINFTGLSVSLTAFMLIALWIQHGLSYDRFHERTSQHQRIVDDPRGVSH